MKNILVFATLILLATPLLASAHSRAYHWRIRIAPIQQTVAVSAPVVAAINSATVATQPVPVSAPAPATNAVVATSSTTSVKTISTSSTAAPTTATTTTAPAAATMPAPAASGLCINYGYQPKVSGQYDWNQVDQNLATLKAAGINCVRLAYMNFSNPNTEALALRAKSQGFSVVMGGDWGPISPTDFAAYDAQALAQAKWQQQNGIPQMSLGNEEEHHLSGMSICDWYNHLQSLASQVHGVYSGKVSYEMDGDYVSQYASCGSIGSLDLVGFNLYGGAQFNQNAIQTGINTWGADHVYVSETDCDVGNASTGCSDDSTHATELKNDLMALKSKFPIPFYYFAFSSGGTAPAYWGLYNGTQVVQPLTAAVLGLH